MTLLMSYKGKRSKRSCESRFEIPFTDISFNVRFVTRDIPGEDFHVFDDKVTISLCTEKAIKSGLNGLMLKMGKLFHTLKGGL